MRRQPGPSIDIRAVMSMYCPPPRLPCVKNVPDRQDAASLGKAGLLLDAADSLLENGRDLGRGGLRFGVCAGLERRDDGCGISLPGSS